MRGMRKTRIRRKKRHEDLFPHCRYAGSGWLAAPRANPEDGLLDLVVIEDVGVQEVLVVRRWSAERAPVAGCTA